jgi:hypothetical protein
MINNNDEILIKKVQDFINNNSQLTKIFTHHKVKYPIDDMLKNILIILKTGISYRDIQKHTFINWNTIYSLYGRASQTLFEPHAPKMRV